MIAELAASMRYARVDDNWHFVPHTPPALQLGHRVQYRDADRYMR
jgi:hypothetical protein